MAIAAPSIAAAQATVEVGPLLGHFRPLGSFESATVYSTALPVAPRDLSGLAVGGEARIWFGARVGGELRASVARSTVPSVSTPGGPSPSTPARVTTLSAQALFTIAGTPGRNQVWLSGGLGVVRHGGKAYEPYTSLTDPGPIAGAGVRLGVTHRLQITGGISAVTYMFDMPMPPALRLNPGSLERGRQLDLLFHLGMSWVMVRG